MHLALERIEICQEDEPRYEFCRDADWWKENISCGEEGIEPTRVVAVASSSSLESEFKERAERWEQETAVQSSPGAKFLHRDYQSIIGMGKLVIPLILTRIETSGRDWFWALEHIAGVNPGKNATDFKQARRAWLVWGRQNGYLASKP